MLQTVSDPCLLFATINGLLQGVTGIRVDDNMCAGNTNFLENENYCCKLFSSKATEATGSDPVHYIGIGIAVKNKEFTMQQSSYFHKQDKMTYDRELPFSSFRSLRATYAYAVYSTVPEILIHITVLAQFREEHYT